MAKFEMLDLLINENKGILTTSEALRTGISKSYFGEFVRERGLTRISHGVYMSPDAWDDGMYLLQTRFPQSIFSHETASYLLGIADREPLRYSVTVKSSSNTSNINKQGVKAYKIKDDLHQTGIIEVQSPAGHTLKVYNLERTVCDLIRSRSGIEIQALQTSLKEYVRHKDKNLPLLMRYAKTFRVEKILKQYLEVLL